MVNELDIYPVDVFALSNLFIFMGKVELVLFDHWRNVAFGDVGYWGMNREFFVSLRVHFVSHLSVCPSVTFCFKFAYATCIFLENLVIDIKTRISLS